MKVKAVRLHAANDLRLDTFELPEIKDDEILVKVVSDSICMSTYKCAILGTGHKRVHPDVAEHPAIMGHEFAGDIVKVGKAHQDKFKPGMKFTLQPALNYKGTMWSPGYSYEFFGGDATYCIIPAEVTLSLSAPVRLCLHLRARARQACAGSRWVSLEMNMCESAECLQGRGR